MQPIKLKKVSEGEIFVKWDDDEEFTMSLQYVRDRCPCASCAGESVLWREYKPSPLKILTPGKYELKTAEVVGNYAIALAWGDGHNTGLYAFDYLYKICREAVRTSDV
ncbi:MAG TPA: DUF971 domain-containing protein [Candidatus Acidoferrales bacterium]|nr:DUF971 domain-containing protein [Candidatus Acidoferrales bacterium]